MSTPTTSIETLRVASENKSLLRKPLRMLAWLADRSVTPVEALTGANGQLLALDPLWTPVGLLAKETGIAFPAESETSTIESVNHGGPTREDFDSATRQVRYTAQETKRSSLEMAYAVDLGAPLQKPNGEVGFPQPTLPEELERALLVVAADPKGQWFMGKFFPYVSPKQLSEITWSPSSAISYETQLSVFPDDVLGYPVFEIPIAGPGAKAAMDAGITGFEAVVG